MSKRELQGQALRDFVQEQINQQATGTQTSLAPLDAVTATRAWLETLRAAEEFINLYKFGIDNDEARSALGSIRSDPISSQQARALHQMFSDVFSVGVATRFTPTLERIAAISACFRVHEMEAGKNLRTISDAVDYFQSRRRQMVALLYWMPTACRGSTPVEAWDALNIFLPIVETSCVGLTSLYRHLVLSHVHDDYKLTVADHGMRGNYQFDVLDDSYLEPERVAITEVPMAHVDHTMRARMLELDSGKIFSVAELCNDLLAMERGYSEFNLAATPFGQMARFIMECSRYARDDFHIEIASHELETLMQMCGIQSMARRRLIYSGKGYSDAINSFAAFILVGRTYLTTVTLLSRFAYNWKTICLNKIKRFQIRSGFIFEAKVKEELAKQGFDISDVKRIDGSEFDVLAIRDGVVYNVQCKNNLVDLARMENDPRLFARYNRGLDRYYADAIRKEEARELLVRRKFGASTVKHIVLSKFPVASKNGRVLAFREIGQFTARFVE